MTWLNYDWLSVNVVGILQMGVQNYTPTSLYNTMVHYSPILEITHTDFNCWNPNCHFSSTAQSAKSYCSHLGRRCSRVWGLHIAESTYLSKKHVHVVAKYIRHVTVE